MKKLVNLTPHIINICNEEGAIISSIESSGVARVATTSTVIGDINGVPVVKNVFGNVTGLPEPEAGTVFIVSMIVKSAVPHRDDVVVPDTSPSSVVRDSGGNIIGVKRFSL